jgi:putative DNA primase/helicase
VVGTKSKQWEQNQKLAFFVVDGVAGVRSGVYWHEPKNEDDDKELTHPLWLCSPLHITAETRDAEQSNWGRLLQWSDNDGHSHRWACPIEILASSDTADFRKELARNGLTINTNARARQRLTDYVTTFPPEMGERIRCVTRIGWHGLRYVLPHSVYGDQTGEGVIYQGADIGDFAQAGTLAEWQQHISKPAAGNSRIVFALSVAFTGVLCEMAGESGGGFHFVGTTSKGKTSTLLDPAASVWGNPERYAKKWRTTTNGLESLCVGRNDGLLILDELAQVAPQEAGSAAYLIANGQAKARMTKDGGNRPSSTWRVMLLSAGEIDLSQHMAEGGKTAKGGQMARLPAIPADAGKGLGTLENLHQFANGQAFADSLKNNTRQHYGTAGTTFLNRLTNAEELARVRSTIKNRLATINALLEVPKGCAPEVGRVASRFALTALAGELATSYGITGWLEGEATAAVKRCFTDWLTENGAGIGNDDLALAAQVTAFMQTHCFTRFPLHNSEDEHLERCFNRAGFSYICNSGATEYWVQTETFKNELCKGFNPRLAASTLTRLGLLQEGDAELKNGKPMQRQTQKKRVKALGKPMPFYVFNDSVLEGAA